MTRILLIDDDVKLTFFSADHEHRRLIAPPRDATGIPIASFPELCDLKAIVVSSRSKSRDWLDLFVLERDYQYGLEEWKRAYDKAGLSTAHFESALRRICNGALSPNDEGFEALIDNPPTVEVIAAHFSRLRSAYEVDLARKTLENGKT